MKTSTVSVPSLPEFVASILPHLPGWSVAPSTPTEDGDGALRYVTPKGPWIVPRPFGTAAVDQRDIGITDGRLFLWVGVARHLPRGSGVKFDASAVYQSDPDQPTACGDAGHRWELSRATRDSDKPQDTPRTIRFDPTRAPKALAADITRRLVEPYAVEFDRLEGLVEACLKEKAETAEGIRAAARTIGGRVCGEERKPFRPWEWYAETFGHSEGAQITVKNNSRPTEESEHTYKVELSDVTLDQLRAVAKVLGIEGEAAR